MHSVRDSRQRLLSIRLLGPFELPISLGGDPAPNVLGAVDDTNPSGFDGRQKADRGPSDERDVREIEDDSLFYLVGEQLPKPIRVLLVHVPA